MKVKTITLLLCVLCVCRLQAQFDPSAFLESPETTTTDSWSGTDWELGALIINTFDEDCRILTSTTSFNGFDVTRILYDYNGQGELLQNTTQIWNGMNWDNSALTEFTYSNGNIDTEIESIWIGMSWMLSTLTDYDYDGSDQRIEEIFQQRNITNTDWDNIRRTEYTYNGSGLEIVNLTQIWSGGMWMNSMQILTSYNGSDFILERRRQNYNGSDWDNSELETYIYMSSALTEIIYDLWDGTDWAPNEQSVFAYDGNQMFIQSDSNVWDGNAYIPTDRNFYSYNSDGFISEIIAQEYVDDDWENLARLTYTYPACATLSVAQIEIVNLIMYPNPADEHSVVSGLSEDTSAASYDIYDVSGRSVQKGHLNNNTISTRALSSGLYIVQLKINATTISKRLVVKH